MKVPGSPWTIRISDLLLFLVILFNFKMDYENLVQIPMQLTHIPSQVERVTYTRSQLVQIGDHVNTFKGHVRLSGWTCANIRKCGIRRDRPRRRKRAGVKLTRRQRHEVNFNNLVTAKIRKDIEIMKIYNRTNINAVLVNIRSIKKKTTELADYVRVNNTDLVIITETWLKPEDEDWLTSNSLTLVGYKMLSSVRKSNKKGGGIAIAHNENIGEVVVMDEEDRTHWQYTVWRVTITKKIQIYVMGVYHPPLTKGFTDNMFMAELMDTYADLSIRHHDLIVVGDFNIHVDDQENKSAQGLHQDLEIMGLQQHVSFSTHNHGHVLDLVISDRNSKVKIIKCSPGDFLSDHRAVHMTFSVTKQEFQQQVVKVTKEEDVDMYDLCAELDLGGVGGEDVDELWSQFEERVIRAMEKLIITEDKLITKRQKVPWMTSEVKDQKQIVRRREKIWKKYGETHQWVALQRERKRYRYLLDYYKEHTLATKISECNGNIKKLYDLVSTITGTKSENPLPDIENGVELCEGFADYFITKIEKIRKSQENCDLFDTNNVKVTVTEKIKNWSHVSETGICNVIKGMKTKQCEKDIIPTHILKKDASTTNDDFLPIHVFLAKLFNTSIDQSKFPDAWRCALVKPLMKGKNLERTYKNYRPVSNLIFVSKLLERVILNQLVRHCEENDLMPSYQSAYRRDHSCETALVTLTNSILWAMERGQCMALVGLDLSAAFDTVHRETLLNVMRDCFGIEDNALGWLESYLGPRGFKIKIGEAESDYHQLESGVAQGSCLGPVLYSCYASTLQYVIPEEIEIFGFADDHALEKPFKPDIDEHRTISLLQDSLVTVNNWMDENRLRMNSGKTEFIIFGSRQQVKKCDTEVLNVCGEIVPKSKCIKYLGANLDTSLSFEIFVKNKCIKAMVNLKRIQRIRRIISRDNCHKLVLSLVITHLDYANSLLFGISDIHLNKLQRIQNAAAKTICNKGKYDSATDCLRELHWLPVRARIEYKILTLVFKSINNLAPVYLIEMFKFKEKSAINLRSYSDIHLEVPRVKKQTFAARSISYAGPLLWNNLPPSLKYSRDFDEYKKLLKTFLFTKYLS